MESDDVTRFLTTVRNWGRANDAAVISFVAYRDGDIWSLSYAVVLLSPIDKYSPETISVNTELIKAGRFKIFDLDEEKLNQLFGGKLNTPDGTFSINTEGQSTYPRYLPEGNRPVGEANVRTPMLMINNVGSDSMKSKLNFQEVEYLLRSHTVPYESIDDLLAAVGLQRDIPFSDARRIEILMGVPADIVVARSKIENGKAIIPVAGNSKLSKDKIRLGVRIPNDAGFSRMSIEGRAMDWEDAGETVYGKAQVSIGTAKYLQAFLSVNGEAISRWWIVDQERHLNPRMAIHRLFDREEKKLRRLLFPLKTESRDLEKGVGMLLGLSGFSVLQYGEKESVQEGPDLIAETGNRRLLVIECTTEMVDVSSKATKLLLRTNRILKELRSNEFDTGGILPVLTTTMNREELRDEFDGLSKRGIVILTRENLEELLERVGLPPHPERLWDELNQSIHSSTSDFFRN